MKVTGIISAIVFAHVTMGQAGDSTSTAASTSVSGTRSASKSSSSTASNATPTGSSSVGELTQSYPADSLIPSGISANCSTFLNSLNSDTSVSTCFASFNTALSAFISGPGSASAVPDALNSLCAISSCTPTIIRPKLTGFKDACSDELAAGNNMIVQQYDVWYTLLPFKSAICAKDSSNYCLYNTSSTSSTTSNTRRSDVRTLGKRAQTVIAPKTDVFRQSNLMYLFTSPDMSKEQLCTSCTQQILSKYIAFESATPYALGISKSPLLGGQTQLWAGMQDKCGNEFTTEITNAAGVATAEQLSDAVTTTASYFTALAAAFAAALALF